MIAILYLFFFIIFFNAQRRLQPHLDAGECSLELEFFRFERRADTSHRGADCRPENIRRKTTGNEIKIKTKL